MRARWSRVTALALAAAAAGGWWSWSSRHTSERAPEVPPSVPSEFQGVTVSEQDPDGTRWSLTAERGTAFEAESTGGLEQVAVVIERGGRRLRARAGRGQVAGGEVVTLSDGVEAEWDDYRVRLEQAVYERGRGRVRSEGPVELVGEGLQAKGGAVEIDVGARRARVSSGVHAVFSPAVAR